MNAWSLMNNFMHSLYFINWDWSSNRWRIYNVCISKGRNIPFNSLFFFRYPGSVHAYNCLTDDCHIACCDKYKCWGRYLSKFNNSLWFLPIIKNESTIKKQINTEEEIAGKKGGREEPDPKEVKPIRKSITFMEKFIVK